MAMSDVPRVLLDTSVLLAWIKGEPQADRVAELLDFIDRGQAVMLESTVILAEVLRRPSDQPGRDSRMELVQAKLRSAEVTLLDVTPPVARKAAEYRTAGHVRKTPDALHLATAVLNRCDWLVTLDNDFPQGLGVEVFNLTKLPADAALPWMVAVQDQLPGDDDATVVPLVPRV